MPYTSLGARLQQSGGIPINELGGRFGMALSALRGEFDPDASVEVSSRLDSNFCPISAVCLASFAAISRCLSLLQNTEKSQNLILGALVQFPAQHTFNVVVKPPVVAVSCRCTDWHFGLTCRVTAIPTGSQPQSVSLHQHSGWQPCSVQQHRRFSNPRYRE